MSQEPILSTINTLLGELEKLKGKLDARDEQGSGRLQSDGRVAELEKEIIDLKMENARLSSIITSLKEQLKVTNEEKFDESYSPCVPVVSWDRVIM